MDISILLTVGPVFLPLILVIFMRLFRVPDAFMNGVLLTIVISIFATLAILLNMSLVDPKCTNMFGENLRYGDCMGAGMILTFANLYFLFLSTAYLSASSAKLISMKRQRISLSRKYLVPSIFVLSFMVLNFIYLLISLI